MDTNFLETFVAVVESGSLAGAARRLNITPAAVAQRMEVLEYDIGTALVARSGRVARPTAAGLAILQRSRDFLRDARDLRAIAGGPKLAGELRVGAVSSALTGIIPVMLDTLFARHTGIKIYLEPGVSMDLYGRLVEDHVDVAIIVKPRFAYPKTCVSRLLRREELVVLAPAELEGDALTLLRTQPFIRYDRNQWGGRLADDFLRRHRLEPMERFELDALDAIAVMVGRGLGVSIVPDWSAPWPETAPLRKIGLPDPKPVRDIEAIWLASSPRGHLVEAFLADASPGEKTPG